MSGRTADGSATPLGQNTGNIAKWQALAVHEQVLSGKPADMLTGRHLIAELGLNQKTDGRRIGAILKAARQAQDDGQFSDLAGALVLVKQLEI